MALKVFRGDAPAVAQVDTVQVTANDAATTYSLTINGKSVNVVGNAGGVNDTASDLADAWNASAVGEFAEITASVATDTITLTADTAGVPFVVSKSTTDGTGTLGSVTSVTVADGPKCWSAQNFGGSLPVDSDDVVVVGNVELLYFLDQSAVTLDSLKIMADDTGAPVIGLKQNNASGNYKEYRTRYLSIGATVLEIGNDNESKKLQRIQIDTGADQVAAVVHKGTVSLIGSHASNILHVIEGEVSVATEAGQVAQFATITNSGNAKMYLGSGVTVATVNAYGSGSVELTTAVTTLTLRDTAKVRTEGTGAITTAKVYGGDLDYRSSGTITTLNVGKSGTFDTSKNLTGCTVTNANMTPGAEIVDTNDKVTWTNPYAITNGSLQDIKHETGRNVTVLIASGS